MFLALTLTTAATFGIGVLLGACLSAWIFGLAAIWKDRR